MSIKRRGPLPAQRFTMIPNDWVRDERLSFRARGVLAYLMSHVESWETSVSRLAASGTEGRDAIQTTINELEDLGYLVREQRHGEAGRFAGVDYILPMSDTVPTVDGFSVDGEPVDGFSVDGEPVTKKTIPLEDHPEEDQPPSSPEPAAPARVDVERMLNYFDTRIEQVGVLPRRPNRTKTNRDAARLMLDLDGYDPHEIRQVIDWATADSFWAPNIGSVRKLREKYPQLRARMTEQPRATRQQQTDDLFAAALARAEAGAPNPFDLKAISQ